MVSLMTISIGVKPTRIIDAIELNPGYASAYQWAALSLASTGRVEEGVNMARRAQELDPLSLIINAYLGFAYYESRITTALLTSAKKLWNWIPISGRAQLSGLAMRKKGLRTCSRGSSQGSELSGALPT